MAKYSLDFKLEVIHFYLTNNSLTFTSNHFNVIQSTIRKWVKAYQYHGVDGIKPRASKNIYSLEFKLHVLDFIKDNGFSIREASAYFNIPAMTTLLEWQNLYEEGGIKAIKPKPKGRPKMTQSKPLTSKNDHEKSVDELIDELEDLRAEVAYLKKLEELEKKILRQKRKS